MESNASRYFWITFSPLAETQGDFTPASFSSVESHMSLLYPLVRFVWAGVNAAIALGCAPKVNQTLEWFVCVEYVI